MHQAVSTRETTAAVARRVVRRVLTVVGGAAAGTALAWALSTSTATADDLGGLLGGAEPVVSPVVSEFVTPLGGAVEDTVDGAVDGLLRPSADPIKDSLDDVGTSIKDAAERFGRQAVERVDVLPDCSGPLCGSAGVSPADLDDTGLGRAEAQTAAPVVPVPATARLDGSAVDPDRIAERTATGRAHADGMSRRGSPAEGIPATPAHPSWPTPFAPVPPSVPAPGHSSQAGGHPADSLPSAALPWQDRTPGLVRGLTVPTTDVTGTAGRVGAQPGVSPD